jgi:universal stress protein F
MFNKVLFPIDLVDGDICKDAGRLVIARAHEWKSTLYVMNVLPGFGSPLVASYFAPDAEQLALAEARRRLDSYLKDNVPEDLAVTPLLCMGTPYEEILREAETREVDLIVIPSHDRKGMDRFLLGSTASKVVAHAHCSVMVLRNFLWEAPATP